MGDSRVEEENGHIPRWITPPTEASSSSRRSRWPSPRSFHSCSLFDSENLVIFGGVCGDSNQPRFLNDVWVKDVSIDDWRDDLVVFSGSQNQPSPRCRHTAVALRKGLYVFGGASNAKEPVDGSVYCLERTRAGDKFRWIRLITIGSQPCPRFGHCAERISESAFMVFGGRSLEDGTDLKDWFTFDTTENVWFRVDLHGSLRPPPGMDFSLMTLEPPSIDHPYASLLLIGARPAEVEDEFIGHQVGDNVVAYAISNRNHKGEWSTVPIRFTGLRSSAARQMTSSTCSQRLCLAAATLTSDEAENSPNLDVVPPLDPAGSGDANEPVTRQLRSFSTSERRQRSKNTVWLFPADRWFPTVFRTADEYVYLMGGMRKKTGERPSPVFAWRFRLNRLAVGTSSIWATWECVRIRDAPDPEVGCRVGWSMVEVDARVVKEILLKARTAGNGGGTNGLEYTLRSIEDGRREQSETMEEEASFSGGGGRGGKAETSPSQDEGKEDVSAIVPEDADNDSDDFTDGGGEEDEDFVWDLGKKVLFIFGGTEVANSYLEDAAALSETPAMDDYDDRFTVNVDRSQRREESSFNSALMMMMDISGEESLDTSHQRMQNRVVREVLGIPLVIAYDTVNERMDEDITLTTMQVFEDLDDRMQHTRVTFVNNAVAVRFFHDELYAQSIPVVGLGGGKRYPSLDTSLQSFKAFDANSIWALSRDMSLFLFQPRSNSPSSAQQLETHSSAEDSSATSPTGVSVSSASTPPLRDPGFPLLSGVWSRISRPVVLPSPSTGTQFEFIDSELSVLWPEGNRDGFALERFSPNAFYLKHRQFSDFERPFDGDVLVLMGGIKRGNDPAKAAKLLGIESSTKKATAMDEPIRSKKSSSRTSTAKGETDSTFLCDIWIAYSTYSSRRNYFSPPSPTLCSWKKLWPPSELTRVNADDGVFAGRARHTLTALPSLGLLAVFGGVADELGRSPQAKLVLVDFTLRSRDFTNVSLSVPSQSGREPSARYDHAAAATTDEETPRLVICGGRPVDGDDGVVLGDVFVWEVCTGAWSEVLLNTPVRSLGWLHYNQGRFYYFERGADDDRYHANSAVSTFRLH